MNYCNCLLLCVIQQHGYTIGCLNGDANVLFVVINASVCGIEVLYVNAPLPTSSFVTLYTVALCVCCAITICVSGMSIAA